MYRVLERICSALNYVAAAWLMVMAIVIFVEVVGRGFFSAFLGGDEIVTNSVPAVVFLQVPLAILTGSMLRTTISFDHLNKKWRHIVNAVSYLMGMALMIGIAVGGWTDMIKGWEIGEYQGIGALEVPVYPIRTIIIASAILITLIYFVMLMRAAGGNDTTPGAQADESGATEEI